MNESKYAKILSTVVENGRLTLGTVEELENEIEFESSEQGLNEEETQVAVKYAKEHYKF